VIYIARLHDAFVLVDQLTCIFLFFRGEIQLCVNLIKLANELCSKSSHCLLHHQAVDSKSVSEYTLTVKAIFTVKKPDVPR
jgi:hypothetical protein